MEKLELHFFHGFLGEVEDWQPVIESLPENLRHHCVCHSLLNDIEQLNAVNFLSWAKIKNQQLQESNHKKVLVGYSLGGRLLMHLAPQSFEALVLIASHPGLLSGKEEREKKDQSWVDQLNSDSVESWLKAWNAQEVFKNDVIRPRRQGSPQYWQAQMKILKGFSLSQQDCKDDFLREQAPRVYWLYGDRDDKYRGLLPRIEKNLAVDHIKEIASSGHGVLFDQPQALAKVILGVLQDVE